MASTTSAKEGTIDVEDVTPHLMRITSHGHIRLFVKFALDFLQTHPRRPLVLHTKPPVALPSESQNSYSNTTKILDAQIETNAEASKAPEDGPPPKKRTKLSPATNTTPRLISVVEIIKREYLTSATRLAHKLKDSDIPKLYQYNYLGYLENADVGALPSEEIPMDLEAALSGKNHLQIHRTPYMKVYLCRTELSPDVVGSATYQAPLGPPPKSRAAKARERKRRKKANTVKTAGEASGTEQPEPSAEPMRVD